MTLADLPSGSAFFSHSKPDQAVHAQQKNMAELLGGTVTRPANTVCMATRAIRTIRTIVNGDEKKERSDHGKRDTGNR